MIIRCICGVLADKLVILVTHQLQYAEHADCILVLKEVCVLIVELDRRRLDAFTHMNFQEPLKLKRVF